MTGATNARAGAGTPDAGFNKGGGKPAERPTGQILTTSASRCKQDVDVLWFAAHPRRVVHLRPAIPADRVDATHIIASRGWRVPCPSWLLLPLDQGDEGALLTAAELALGRGGDA